MMLERLKKNHRTIGQVFQTSDYSLFSYVDGNRNIKIPHLKRLQYSIQKKQIPVPIIIDNNYNIYDGQHRFEACKNLNLPIYYIIVPELGLNDIQTLNANMKNWTTDDYCDSYCKLGTHPEYYKYRDYKERFKFGHNETLVLLNGSSKSEHESRGLWQDFRDGNFKVINYAESIEFAKKILMTEPYYDGCRRRSFVFALLHCFKQKQYDHKIFMKKLKFQSAKLFDQTTVQNYLILIEKIYNYKNKHKARLFTN